eukprot:scaffold2144_cov215-Pinguiococcus_pyrenoidosus.AAC.15
MPRQLSARLVRRLVRPLKICSIRPITPQGDERRYAGTDQHADGLVRQRNLSTYGHQAKWGKSPVFPP